ncbi:MAG: restriction endonuclease subunit S [Ruminiclostridium sp.]|nr:restriction endonuclease subunit S [Ruminiclostridium sp.]
MREMKDSGIEWIGEIPADWKLTPFRNILFERSEKNIPIKTDERLSLSIDVGITLYAEKTTNLDRYKDDVSQYKIAHIGDLVLNSMNVIVGAVGVSPYYGCVSPAYYTYYDKEENHYLSRFCDYLFRCKTLRQLLFTIGKGIMAIDRGDGRVNTCRLKVSREDLTHLKFPFPNIDEIRAIVNCLDFKCSEIDSLISDIQKQIDTLEEYKRSVITEAVTKGLDPDVEMRDSGVQWVGMMPAHWKMKRGKYMFCQRNTRGNNIVLQLLSPTQKYGVIPQTLYEEISGYSAVKLNDKTDFSTLKTIHKGDYCISLRSFQGGFEYSEYEGVVSPAYQVFYPTINLCRDFYKHLFKTQVFIDEMNSFTMSLRDGKNIAYDDFGNTYLPIPPINEQQKIADHLGEKCAELDGVIADKKKQIETIEEYKKSLIFEYVTGKKEVV